ncbi:hypothetical protein HPK19_00415 [Arthrobacter citreus]|nr:hypothetical protein HPK19_00415 [Arthrobacter citreus]
MTNCATIQECVTAESLGFDFVGITLYGYTEEIEVAKFYFKDFKFLKQVVSTVSFCVLFLMVYIVHKNDQIKILAS